MEHKIWEDSEIFSNRKNCFDVKCIRKQFMCQLPKCTYNNGSTTEVHNITVMRPLPKCAWLQKCVHYRGACECNHLSTIEVHMNTEVPGLPKCTLIQQCVEYRSGSNEMRRLRNYTWIQNLRVTATVSNFSSSYKHNQCLRKPIVITDVNIQQQPHMQCKR